MGRKKVYIGGGLSFGCIQLEVTIRHPREDVKLSLGCSSLAFESEMGLEMNLEMARVWVVLMFRVEQSSHGVCTEVGGQSLGTEWRWEGGEFSVRETETEQLEGEAKNQESTVA